MDASDIKCDACAFGWLYSNPANITMVLYKQKQYNFSCFVLERQVDLAIAECGVKDDWLTVASLENPDNWKPVHRSPFVTDCFYCMKVNIEHGENVWDLTEKLNEITHGHKMHVYIPHPEIVVCDGCYTTYGDCIMEDIVDYYTKPMETSSGESDSDCMEIV
jgi:hypothetical protein